MIEIRITKKYLIIPVSVSAPKKSLCFMDHGELVFDLFACYQASEPDYVFYQSTAPIAGRDIEITVDGEAIVLEQTDVRPDVRRDEAALRPYIHFTAQRGWTNDPNGLCFDGKTYHMFFQHNPVGTLWGNMHWGHAVSTDLIHWSEMDTALFPDKFGTMYSGSAIVDHDNVSGFGVDGKPAICLFYTSCGDYSNGGNSLLSKGMESLQHLAYSTDGGKTFVKYENNPIIGEITKENRDPKVIYAEELGQYLMALYLEGYEYMLLTSSDLIHWEERQRLTIPGETECPDIYPLNVDGDPNERIWVISGASDRYIVGKLWAEGELFRPVQGVKEYQMGKGTYAAQSFSGIKGRRIRTSWGLTPAPNCIFNNQMAAFAEVSLSKIGSEYFLRSNPIEEYRAESSVVIDEKVTDRKEWTLDEGAFDITVTPSADCGELTLNVFGREFEVDCSRKIFKDGSHSFPASYSGEMKIRIIADTLGLELFIDNGLIYYAIPLIGTPRVSVDPSEGCCAVEVRRLGTPKTE